MNPDQFGVYTNADGSRYFISNGQTVNLTYYNPANGDYAEAGDTTVYDNSGNDTGNIFNGSAVVPSGGGSSSSGGSSPWLGVLNTALGAAGNIFGHSSSTLPAGTYTPIYPAAPVKTGPSAALIIGGILVIGGIVFVAWHMNKNKKAGAAK